MISKIKNVFEKFLSIPPEADESALERSLQVATAALMVELIKADNQITAEEEEAIITTLRNTFRLEQEALDQVLEAANTEAADAVSLYGFTRLINEHYSREQKETILESLWTIALADNSLDMHEDHLLKKLTDLLHIPRERNTYFRHKVRQATATGEEKQR